MTGKTHRVGGMLCCLGGYVLLEKKGMLISNVNPLLQLTVMYPFAIYGSIFSDLDHNSNSIPSRDLVSLIINKILHLTTGLRQKGITNPILNVFDAKHRSWQTHSDLFFVTMLLLVSGILSSNIGDANAIIFKLIALGFGLGVLSHLILDMLTPEGVWCIVTTLPAKVAKSKKIPQKIKLVPSTKFFSTGGSWESLVRWIMWVACFILLVRIIYIASPYKINISL